jgi:radical SAM superfamily enzyme YgiQ (UPF0313 family)
MTRPDALEQALSIDAEIVGVYSMMTMQEDSVAFARHLRSRAKLLVAGGPLPSCNPTAFLDDFDVVVIGEGERTMAELLGAYETGASFAGVTGIVYREDKIPGRAGRQIAWTPPRALAEDLDAIPFPPVNCFPMINISSTDR